MIEYNNNTDIKKMIDKILIDKDMTKTEVAEKMNVSRQRVSNILSKENITLSDVKSICDAIGCKLYINIE